MKTYEDYYYYNDENLVNDFIAKYFENDTPLSSTKLKTKIKSFMNGTINRKYYKYGDFNMSFKAGGTYEVTIVYAGLFVKINTHDESQYLRWWNGDMEKQEWLRLFWSNWSSALFDCLLDEYKEKCVEAYIITSQEYQANNSHNFIFCTTNQQYYGIDMLYPKINTYPNNIDYWRHATSSDSDRGFKIKTIYITPNKLAIFKKYCEKYCLNNKKYSDIINKLNVYPYLFSSDLFFSLLL